MSSSSFRSAQSSRSTCFCGIPVAKKQSWTSGNPGRRFGCCKFSNPFTDFDGCKYFEWLDDDMVEWQRFVTNQLLHEKKLLENENKHLKGKVCNLQDQKANLQKDLEKLRGKLQKKAVAAALKVKGKKNEWYMSFSLGVVFVVVVVAVLVGFCQL